MPRDRATSVIPGAAGPSVPRWRHAFASHSRSTSGSPPGDGKGYTLEAAIPWEALGVAPRVGTRLLFDIAIDNSTNGESRQHQIMWNGTMRNSTDRTHWGAATLIE